MAETIIVDVDEDIYEPEEENSAAIISDDEAAPGGDDAQVSEEEEEVDEIEIEGQRTAVTTEKGELATLREEVRELRSALLQASRQSAPKETAPKVSAKEEDKVSRGQLLQILNENRDAEGNIRPDILMNVVDYLVENKTNEVKNQAFQELNQSNWEREVSGVSNRVLAEDSYLKSNPALNDKINEIASNLRLDKHPAGRLAAYALIRYGEAGTEQAATPAEEITTVVKKKKSNAGRMDKTHVNVDARSKSAKLNAEQLAMAKRFGVKPETYARFVK